MNKTVIAVVIAVVLAAGLGLVFGLRGAQPSRNPAASNILSVDVVSASPGKYAGPRRVSGTVSTVDQAKHSFSLGCADACAGVPVIFDGELPNPRSNVVVTGVIAKQNDGTYRFTASKVEAR